jgi:hypothetical protein
MPFREGPRKAHQDEDGNPTFSCTWQGMFYSTQDVNIQVDRMST